MLRTAFVFGALLLSLCGTATSQWQSIPRPGADFQSIEAKNGIVTAVGSGTRMARSTDGGVTWIRPFVLSSEFRGVPLDLSLLTVSTFAQTGLIGGSSGLVMRFGRAPAVYNPPDLGDDDILGFAATTAGTSQFLFAGGFGGGVRRSSDGGFTWASMNAGLTNVNVTCLTAGAELPDSSGQSLFAGTYGGGVFVTLDNGESWYPRHEGLGMSNVNSLVRFGTALYACGGGGTVFQSTDEGLHWQAVGHGLPNTDVLSVCVVEKSGQRWLVCGTVDQGVWRCPESGGAWAHSNTGIESPRINALAALQDTLFAATTLGIFRSLDLGGSWQNVSEALLSSFTDIDALTKESSDVFAAGTNAQYMGEYFGFGSMYTTEDNGKSWNTSRKRFNGGILRVRHAGRVIFAHAKGDVDYGDGLNISEDYGKSWEPRFDGRARVNFRCMDVIERADSGIVECIEGLSYGPEVGFWASSDTGRTWRYLREGKRTAAVGGIGKHWLAVDQTGIFHTSDGGLIWTDVSPRFQGKGILFFEHDATRLYAGIARDSLPASTGGVLASADSGATWFNAGLVGKAVTSLIAQGSVLLAVADGRVYAADRVGLEWVDVTGNLVSCPAAVVAATPSRCYVRSADGQSLWSRPMTEIAAALVLPLPVPGTITLLAPAMNATVGQDSVIFRWRSVGPVTDRYWLEYGADSAFVIKAVDSVLTDTLSVVKNLVKGTTYYWRVRAHNVSGWGPFSQTGHFSRTLTSTYEVPSDIPGESLLSQNFPNPFNPVTTIVFGLPSRMHVSIKVYNSLGEEVAILTDEDQDAGYHAVRFDGAALPSGLYFYRMRAGSASFVRRLALIK